MEGLMKNFNTLTPVDMIFKTDTDGNLTPVRFKAGGNICNITGFRIISPAGEMTTRDGVYMSGDIALYEAAYDDGGNIRHRVRLYYFKKDTVWEISRPYV